MRLVRSIVVMALLVGAAAGAQAQPASTSPTNPKPAGSAESLNATTVTPGDYRDPRGLKPGMVILNRRGGRVGVIRQISQRRNNRPAVLVEVNGAAFTINDSKFRLTRRRDEAVVLLTPSQIRTAAILNTE